ncbi:uncharacterized protein PFLUO_LOCUS443 [Penicillium psychrofluorescens]|uniref:uncharacterized protein n=1 Tax=Penicillium psychrofluorescens TaxID=3158075 RepID=UPI003CCCFDEB
MSPRLLLLVICCFQLGLAVGSSYRSVEQLESVPHGWSKRDIPPASKRMTFYLAIAQTKTAEFERNVVELSTPGHPKYGQHMKRSEVDDFLRPSPDILSQILSWLESEHVPVETIQTNRNWIKFQAFVPQAEKMLKTRFFLYHNDASQTSAIRALGYSVPEELHPHIEMIQPTTRFGNLGPQRALPLAQPIVATPEDLAGGCDRLMTPDCLRDMYGLYDTEAKPDLRNRLGISGFLVQYGRYSDFNSFTGRFAPNHTDANFTVVSINGGLNDQDSWSGSTEASLDIQYAISVAYQALATYYTTGGRGPLEAEADQPNASDSQNEPYLDQLQYLVNLPDDELPAVLSTSYGESEQSIPASYATSVCNLFAQLGARGVSVIFSSGDSGVGGSCLSNDGTNQTRFLPGFPASCPFVTAVGGTYGTAPEKAIDFSGGGFSELFSRPSYQDDAVNSYLSRLGDEWDGLYNRTGRAIPDVATQASNFAIRDHDTYLKISGTSAAAPVFAGIISQLNAARLAQGLPRMGFLNPWLYSVGQDGFTDIVEGGSRGCDGTTDAGLSTPYVPGAGWNATEGWDPATGLGTPFFQTMVQLALFDHV